MMFRIRPTYIALLLVLFCSCRNDLEQAIIGTYKICVDSSRGGISKDSLPLLKINNDKSFTLFTKPIKHGYWDLEYAGGEIGYILHVRSFFDEPSGVEGYIDWDSEAGDSNIYIFFMSGHESYFNSDHLHFDSTLVFKKVIDRSK